MQFSSFLEFLQYTAQAPGFIWNLLVHTFWLLVYYLPLMVWHILVALAKFILHLPVFIYKCFIWLLTLIENAVLILYDYIFLREWGWHDLGYFPAMRSTTTAEIVTEGIDKPFAQLNRDVGNDVKEGLEPLIRAMEWIAQQLTAIPWPYLFPAIVGLVWVTSRKLSVVMLAIAALVYMGLFGLIEPAQGQGTLVAPAWETISLMIMAIILCVSVGVPLGILMSFSDVIERTIKPILDVMQTMPAFVYLIPVLILFGVSEVAGLLATTIYAMPPVIRLTNLGIRLVAFDVIEAANAFGATYRQRLTGVLIPLALPNIFAGINQTIMMALAMVVIAAMVGAGGLGQLVLSAQSNTQLGRGLEYGFAIVFIAIVIDRTFYVVGERMQAHRSVGH